MDYFRKSTASSYLRMLRIDSWIGWFFNFALGSILFMIPPINVFALLSLSIIFATGGIFVLNEYFDREADQLNEVKRKLPVASGEISPKKAILFFLFLLILSMCFALFADVYVMPLFFMYLGLWTCYSAPPFHLKSKPIVDIITAGVGSGVLPFIIGLQTSRQLTLDFSSFWIRRHYQDALLCTIPLFLFQSAGHIFQTVGDYEADLRANVCTFAVKYGKKTSVKVGELFLVAAAVLPILYGILNLSLTNFLYWYLAVFICSVPGMFYVLRLLRTPSRDNLNTLQQISQKAGPAILIVIWIYVYLVRIGLA